MFKELWNRFNTCRSEKFAWEGLSDDRCQLPRWHRGTHLFIEYDSYGDGFNRVTEWERGSKKPNPAYPIIYRAPFDRENQRKNPKTGAWGRPDYDKIEFDWSKWDLERGRAALIAKSNSPLRENTKQHIKDQVEGLNV